MTRIPGDEGREGADRERGGGEVREVEGEHIE